jgi:hypothetical protein
MCNAIPPIHEEVAALKERLQHEHDSCHAQALEDLLPLSR